MIKKISLAAMLFSICSASFSDPRSDYIASFTSEAPTRICDKLFKESLTKAALEARHVTSSQCIATATSLVSECVTKYASELPPTLPDANTAKTFSHHASNCIKDNFIKKIGL